MRDNIETYKIWAPDNSIWAQWAKPVLFMQSSYETENILSIQQANWITAEDCNSMIIVDQPGKKGVEEALALAQLGYRPVPLYNGVFAKTSYIIVKVDDIVAALQQGADELIKINIKYDAPPVFMLDSSRMEGIGRQPGIFDNRWCVFPQDMPSASFLISKNIQKIIVHTEFIRNDLCHILRRYHEKGIKIYQCNGNEKPKEVTIVKPSRFRSLSYRFKENLGLIRNAAGGFGGKVPEPIESSSGGYHGIG